ncbi:MAG: radical SAM protein, partial [Desulfosporosinus sp.]
GTTLGSDGKEMVEIVEAIRSKGKSQAVIDVNCGAALSRESMIELKKLGVRRIGCSFETINKDLFKELKPGDSIEAKKRLAEMISDVGLELGSGLLAGLSSSPTRWKDYVDFIFYIKQFNNLKSIYVSRFFPYKGIPMENHPRCSAMEGARIISIMRLVLRNIDIKPAAGWSYDDIPIWVMAGGGNRAGGVHVNRAPAYKKNWYLPGTIEYSNKMEFGNTMEVSAKFLNEAGITMDY